MISLSTALSLYVRADGNDANDGSADDAAHAFLTLQHAYDYVVDEYHLKKGASITIFVRDGSFVGLSTGRRLSGIGRPEDLMIKGNGATSILTPGTNDGVIIIGENGVGASTFLLDGFKISAPTKYSFKIFGGGFHYKNIEFTQTSSVHVASSHNAWVLQDGPCTVSGGAANHWGSNTGAIIAAHGQSITFQNSPSFTNSFASAVAGGQVYGWPVAYYNGNTVSGLKFSINTGGVINGSSDVNVLPGSSAGINSSGWYV